MRRLIGVVSMTLMLSALGQAQAFDGTQVIYDLTELERGSPAPAAVNPAGDDDPMQLLKVSPPLSSKELSYEWNALGEFEVKTPRREHRPVASGVTRPIGQSQGNTDGPPATPNPEPGTLLLMGTGLAAAARFRRRR